VAAQSDGNIIIIVIIMGIWGLGPLRHGPLDIEAADVSIFVLVFPDNDVRLDNIGRANSWRRYFFVHAKCSLRFIRYRTIPWTFVICNFLRMHVLLCFQA